MPTLNTLAMSFGLESRAFCEYSAPSFVHFAALVFIVERPHEVDGRNYLIDEIVPRMTAYRVQPKVDCFVKMALLPSSAISLPFGRVDLE